MINELDGVTLIDDISEYGLMAGAIGTVVMTHNNGQGFTVEFIDKSGETIAVVSLAAQMVQPLHVDLAA